MVRWEKYAVLCLFLVPIVMAAAPAMGQLAASCKVLDPELQGSYSGSCVDGLADGRGTASGIARYEGEFKGGRKDGKGVKTWPSGDRYEGDFVADRKQGRGTYTWGRNSEWAGQKYSGDYVADQRHGNGTYEWPGGDQYSGPWEHDAMTGPATPAMMARVRANAERRVAVGKQGARVCRDFLVGTVTRDRVRGTVTSVETDRIAVRIDDPGHFPHAVGDTKVAKGATIRDELMSWAPCY